ncbi:MAG: adenylate/guanylate cyclase domain-containing protein, partial [Spirochaetota bacterium]|nr:adenylate/guanylate cyclase domain-containing protein [Spirochaetota bacterium]
LSIGVIIIVVIIVLSVLNRLLIVQPVKFVSNEMQAVGSGDLQRHIEHHKNDEIGDMTRSFNTMVHGLQGFTQYVSKDVVQQILETGTSRIAGTSTKVAIFFSDIRSFTSITETYPANDVVNMLNSYFDTMVPIIQESGGNLDKFIGDAIMAEWGGIEASDKDPYQACYAALLQLDALNHFNEKRRKSATFEINIGMGINYGEAIVGTIGSEGKMEFTVIGDAVNLASRLEGLTKEYGVKIIISHSIAEHVQDYFLCRELDKVAVKGKVEGVRIYELVGRKLDVSPDTINNINKYHDALSLYRNKEFDASIKILDSISDFVTNKAAQRLKYIAKEYLISPPSSDWNGISIKTSK